MDITTYTTYSEIRATCGLSSDELSDTELAMELYQNVLSLALAGIDLTDDAPGPGPLSTRFVTIAAIVEGSRTVLQQKLYDLTRLFCTYTVSLEVMISLSMKAAKSVSDSKASLVRFSPESVYKDVIVRLEASLKGTRRMIENITVSTIAQLPLSKVVEPTIDVITGV